ncbi:MAG: succinylglutamate desuccinylase/aspartoacylase family protein [Salinibacter sp.]|uniref:succinylglutamate desuccinylase/aspartoacylase domain-containing protein n=1 Tax=Salinibacter sp. TaxID=2065818 RepID=UPI0035D50A5C
MHVETLGNGHPEYTVVACVHGDETCGWHAFNRLKASDVTPQAPVKFVLANERAFKLGYRFCDADLNRAMPGDETSEKHEVRLAARLHRELVGTTVIDFHSTESRGCPYAIVTGEDAASRRLARSTGLDRVVDMSHLGGGVTEHVTGVAVECGYHDDEDAASVAHRILLHFLAAQGLIDRPYARSTPEVYEVFDDAPGRGFAFVAQNFRRVEEGEVFARKEGTVRRAPAPFFPVLMSTHGYDDRIGFMARRAGRIDGE